MTRSRQALINAGLVSLILAHLLELARDKEHWPFCSYPMYSWLEREPAVVSQRLVGVLAATGEELALQAPELIHPFDQARLADGFAVIHAAPDAAARWAVVMPDLLDRYERRRGEGLHAGPPLKGMRVYLTRHRLDPWLRNFEHPEHRELIAEATRR